MNGYEGLLRFMNDSKELFWILNELAFRAGRKKDTAKHVHIELT